MADVSSHPSGTCCWAELATTDQPSAVAFYRALFGWDVNDQPIGPAEVYSMFRLRGRDVAAAYTMRPEERQGGAPPHWNLYISVTDADDTVRRAERLGATAFTQAFDVMDSGRMAVLQDPTGAVFQIWEARKHIGARILNEPGALCWSELATHDTHAAESFYTGLFGWMSNRSAPSPGMEYTEFSVDGQPSIGMMPMPPGVPAGTPSYWMPYFQVADCDATTARARELGAQVFVPPRDIPNTGRFAVLADGQGAVFAVFTFAGS